MPHSAPSALDQCRQAALDICDRLLWFAESYGHLRDLAGAVTFGEQAEEPYARAANAVVTGTRTAGAALLEQLTAGWPAFQSSAAQWDDARRRDNQGPLPFAQYPARNAHHLAFDMAARTLQAIFFATVATPEARDALDTDSTDQGFHGRPVFIAAGICREVVGRLQRDIAFLEAIEIQRLRCRVQSEGSALTTVATPAHAGSERADAQQTADPPPAAPHQKHAMATARQLAEKYGVPFGALRKRLDRWRYAHDVGYSEVSNRRKTEPRYLYDTSAVWPVIEAMQQKAATPKRAANGQQKKI